jgi:hypothetical protein
MARFAASYELTAVRGFEAALARASAAMRTRAEQVSRDTAFAVQRHAKAIAPRDRGDLASAIAVDGKGLTWRVGILDVRLPSRGGSDSAHQNPWVYGVWYEYGFVTRKIARREFMGPASRAEQPRHQAALAAALTDALGQVAA